MVLLDDEEEFADGVDLDILAVIFFWGIIVIFSDAVSLFCRLVFVLFPDPPLVQSEWKVETCPALRLVS